MNKIICTECGKGYEFERDAKDAFVCDLCTGRDIAGDIARYRPRLDMPVSFSKNEVKIVQDAMNNYVTENNPVDQIELYLNVMKKLSEIKTACWIWKVNYYNEQQRGFLWQDTK